MPETLFPEKWWAMPEAQYNEAKVALKALIAKDPTSGTAEVIIRDVWEVEPAV